MAAISSYTELKQLRSPGYRAYTMTATDADTFTPPGVTAVKAFADYDADPATGNPIGCTVSSGVVTINCTGLSSVAIIMFVVCDD